MSAGSAPAYPYSEYKYSPNSNPIYQQPPAINYDVYQHNPAALYANDMIPSPPGATNGIARGPPLAHNG